MVLNKYTYNIRQQVYNLLKYTPSFLKGPIIELYVRGQNKQLQKLETPLMLIFYVTSRCNARCSHCFYWQSRNSTCQANELAIDQIKKIASSLKHPLNTLLLTGGEPFLRNDIKEICHVFVTKNKTKKINIASNGYFTGKIVAATKTILQDSPNLDLNIQISLDALKDTHNAIRGVDIFDRALETVEQLEDLQSKYNNFHVTILTTIFQANFDSIDELKVFLVNKFPNVHHGFQFVRSAKFDTYNISRSILEGFDPNESEETLLSVDQMKDALKRGFFIEDTHNALLNNYVRIMNEGVIEMKEKEKRFVACLAGLYDGVIYANGDVSLCEFTKPFANLQDFKHNFCHLWHSDLAKSRRQQIKKCFCAHTCNLMNSMRYSKEALLKVVKNKN